MGEGVWRGAGCTRVWTSVAVPVGVEIRIVCERRVSFHASLPWTRGQQSQKKETTHTLALPSGSLSTLATHRHPLSNSSPGAAFVDQKSRARNRLMVWAGLKQSNAVANKATARK